MEAMAGAMWLAMLLSRERGEEEEEAEEVVAAEEGAMVVIRLAAVSCDTGKAR